MVSVVLLGLVMMAKDYGLTAPSFLESADFHSYSRTTSVPNDSESGDLNGNVSDGSIWKSDERNCAPGATNYETISVPGTSNDESVSVSNANMEVLGDTDEQTKSSIIETDDTKAVFVPKLAMKTTTKFYLLPMPETTTWLLGNFTEEAGKYYETTLNEDQAEVWLHRGLEQLTESQTYNASEADVVIIPGYLHLNSYLIGLKNSSPQNQINTIALPCENSAWIELLTQRVIPGKIHVVATPTTNPGTGDRIGIRDMMNALNRQEPNVQMASFGFERNENWQRVAPKHITPVPYVVSPVLPRQELRDMVWSANRTGSTNNRKENFVFYVGDGRKWAVEWANCDRVKMITPLENRTDMYVRIATAGNRLSQEDYNLRMFTSEYCLIVCGDTPTSRSLASSMLYGCIPIRIGSRLRCEEPCRPGWGWSVAELPHLPFCDKIDWESFPEVDEAAFSNNPGAVLDQFFSQTDAAKKSKFREAMEQTQMGWAYGWGSPVDSMEFGDAAKYAWDSLVAYLHNSTATDTVLRKRRRTTS